MTLREKVEELVKQKEIARGMGGKEAVEKQHARGKLTCRERLDLLLDPGSFLELGILAQAKVEVPGLETKVARAGGVVVGYGTINGRPVFVSADDATVVSGARGESGYLKAARVQRAAFRQNIPIISLMEASAGRVQDQMGSERWAGQGYNPYSQAGVFDHMINLSGRVPLVTAIMGNSVGGAAFIACLSDFVPMVKNTSFMAVSGPPVVTAAVGEKVNTQDLGGSKIHTRITGQADYEAANDQECIEVINKYLTYFPTNCYEMPPRLSPQDNPDRRCPELLDIIPDNPRIPYDMYQIIRNIVDEGKYFELKAQYGKAAITCLARLNGHSVGIIASHPRHMAGVIDDTAAYKITHFMDICDAFHIPLIFLVDVPGFIIGSEWEKRSLLKWVTRAMLIHKRTTVPRLTVILRKAYGMAYWILGGRAMNPDYIVAWPSASMSLMAPEPAVDVIYDRKIRSSSDPKTARDEYLELFSKRFAPDAAAENFGIDDIIDPLDTRCVLIKGLDMCMHKNRVQPEFKHEIWP